MEVLKNILKLSPILFIFFFKFTHFLVGLPVHTKEYCLQLLLRNNSFKTDGTALTILTEHWQIITYENITYSQLITININICHRTMVMRLIMVLLHHPIVTMATFQKDVILVHLFLTTTSPSSISIYRNTNDDNRNDSLTPLRSN